MQPRSTRGRTFLALLLCFAGLALLRFFAGREASHPALPTAERDGLSITQILIDIKPQDFPNGVNPRSPGVLPVAILTNADFHAQTVDPQTVRFGQTGTEASVVQSTLVDVDGDGDLDLLLHFRIPDTGIHCRDTSASLTGHTFHGQALTGSDSLVPVGCR